MIGLKKGDLPMNKNRKLMKNNNQTYKQELESITYLQEETNSLKTSKENKFEKKLQQLEQQPSQTFQELNYRYIDDFENTNIVYNFLYHGIRFQKHLEKLESIFQDRAILAGKYQKKYYDFYDDNCNEGEYISVMSIENGYELEYKTFIMPNISLVISPECNAIKTIYIPYEEWQQLNGRPTKNRYSYAKREYHVKQMIPLCFIKAIGVPDKYLRLTNQEEKIEGYLHDIVELMEKYNINLPIIDTSDYNRPLVIPENHILNYKTRKRKVM